jgi:spore cortex formation protein SpoVR/YcgB (stage V sporulation)
MGVVGYATTIAVVKADEAESHPMIQALAERFGLNEDEVEEVLDEIKADHFAQVQERKQDRLIQAVEDGVITEEQMLALQEKHQEMWSERNQERQEHHEEMDAWFESQGIDHEAIMEYMGGFGRKGGFGMKGHGMRHFQ